MGITKIGWWKVKFDITLDGESIRFSELSDTTQEHILKQILEGIKEGEVIEEYEIGSIGTYNSEWDDGYVVSTEIISFDPTTGYVEAEEDSSPAPKGSLIREWVELADGTEYDVCMQCHAYILKTVMEDDNTGKGIHEVKRCPECENE